MDIPVLFRSLLHLADNSLILAQRNSEWTGHGPVLEQDIAITNIALDLLGQSRNFYQQAAIIYQNATPQDKNFVDALLPLPWKTFDRSLEEDDLAFLREERQYRNFLITELPKGDWSFTILRQFFFSAYQILEFEYLAKSGDEAIAGIAAKSIKETRYHLKWSSEWVIRLGDGTEESRMRLLKSLEILWPYTGEMFTGNLNNIDEAKSSWFQKVTEIFSEAELKLPDSRWFQEGGLQGKHTEHLGYLLSEMQYLQRTYPNLTW